MLEDPANEHIADVTHVKERIANLKEMNKRLKDIITNAMSAAAAGAGASAASSSGVTGTAPAGAGAITVPIYMRLDGKAVGCGNPRLSEGF